MIRVCYIPEGKDYILLRHVARILKDKGIEFLFVARTKDLFQECRRDGFEVYFISNIWDQEIALSQSDLLKFDLGHGPYPINSVYKSDIYLDRVSSKDQVEKQHVIALAYEYWEKFFGDHNIDYLLLVDAAFFSSRAAYNVAVSRGKPRVGMLMPGPGERYIVLCDMGKDYCWSELMNSIKEGYKPLTNEQRRIASDYITDYFSSNKDARERFNIFMGESFIKRFRDFFYYFHSAVKARFQNDPIDAAVTKYANKRLVRQSWYKYVTYNMFSYDKPLKEPYVYFPIFYEREAFNLASFHYWTDNQDSLIKEIAENLPVGMKLYVKEHPATPGELSLKRLQKIKKIRNVRLIHPLTDRQLLIDNSEAVVVLNGSSGWEAYLKRKPVVMLDSKIYFSYSNLIYKANDPCDVPAAIFKAIQNGSGIYDENKEEWLWFIYNVISTCSEGMYMSSVSGVISDHVEDREGNHAKIADYIAQKIRRDLC